MEKAVTMRWHVLGLILLALTLAPAVKAAAPLQVDPEAGFHLSLDAGTMEEGKRAKLDENLRNAAREFRAARFEQAIGWYEAALQLAPAQPALKAQIELTRQLAEAQRQAQSRLPKADKERQAFLKAALEQATRFMAAGEGEKASGALQQLWLTAGDFDSKTVKLLAQARRGAAARAAAAARARGGDAAAPALDQARAEAAAGRVEEARRLLQDVLDREPLNQAARLELSELDRTAPRPQPMNASAQKIVDQPSEAQVKREVEPIAPRPGAVQPKAPAPAAPAVPAIAVPAPVSADPVSRLEADRLVTQARQALDAGDLPTARAHAERVLTLIPGDPRARQILDEIAARGQRPAAEAGPAAELIALGDKLVDEKQYDAAIQRYQEALAADPESQTAANRIARAQRLRERDLKMKDAKSAAELQAQINQLFARARAAQESGDLVKARELWQEVLKLDPDNKLAQSWLEESEGAWQAAQASQAAEAASLERRDEASRLLEAPVSITTDREIPLSEFIHMLSLSTPVELEYYIAEGATVPVMANFQDKSLRSILDTVLPPKGLNWSINDRNVITIEQEIHTANFKLSPNQLAKIQALLDSGYLQNVVWGQTQPPSPAIELTLDQRLRMLFVAGSRLHINRVQDFLGSLGEATTPELETRFYKIREEDGPKIRALIDALIQTDKSSPFDIERKVIVEGDDLIINDTPENLVKIEELLLNQDFIEQLTNEKLDIRNYSLVPREVEDISSDQIQVFTSRVVEAISVFLYNETGMRQATEEGRRMWFDEATLQLTLVDTPVNLQTVEQYLGSLPELKTESEQETIFLEYAEATVLAPSLERILNLTSPLGGGAGGGTNELAVTLGRGDQRQFQGATFRLMRVEENDVEDRNDDTVEISVNVPGTGPQTTTVTELETQIIDNYEVTAEDVLPSSGQPGGGRARLVIRYVPQIFQQQLSPELLQLQQLQQPSIEEAGLKIDPFTELNAIILQYSDPVKFKRAMELITQLDQPTKQVEIETKFVEVNETRAKEFSADFSINGLGSGRSIDWDTQLINTRYASDLDEARDPFGPLIEPLTNSNLIKGTTVVNAVFGTFPNVQWNLRLLEAEGILNIVNGPKVTALHGEEAEFRIETYFPEVFDAVENDLAEIFNPVVEGFTGDFELADQDEVENEGLLNAVVLRVTPSITSDKSIILRELTAELLDFGTNLGNIFTPTVNDVGDITDDTFFNTVVAPISVMNFGEMTIRRKKIITDARISNGGTIVIGGWTGERTEESTSGVPVLRNMPYLGKLLFNRAQRTRNRTTLLIFLTGYLVD